MRTAFALTALVLLVAPLPAQQAPAPFTVVETGEHFARLSDAVDAVGDARATIRIAPGIYRQCAVQEAGEIVYRAATPGQVIFDHVICEGKAALVLRGRAASVDGIVFRNMRVPDENGAGIRLEKGDLSVFKAMFLDSQQGILSASDPGASVRIEDSTFSGLGYCGNDCAHGIYIGHYGALSIAHSRFERGTGGHYVKSRAARVEIIDSSFDDTRGQKTNYMIDLPSGAIGAIRGNTFVQGRDKENYIALVMVAAEGRDNPSAGLMIADNRASIAPGIDRPSTFVFDKSGEKLVLANNRLGPGLTAFKRQ